MCPSKTVALTVVLICTAFLLVLTDTDHVVKAEGFALDELDDKLE